MSDYDALTEKLTELEADASKPCSELCQEQHDEDERGGIPQIYECLYQAKAKEALAAAKHELVAVTLAAVGMSALCAPNPHAAKIKPEIVEKATMERTIPYPVAIALKDALDALQARLTP